MKFYNTSTPEDSLCHYVNDLLNLPSADTDEYPLAQKARAANTYKYKLAKLLFAASDAWEFDDDGYSDLPIATADLVVGQRDYALPTGALTVERIEVMDSAGNYHRLNPIDETDITGALTNYGESNGTPERYWLKGRSIFLDPAPASGAVTLVNGIKVYTSREINEFTAATTTVEVGFDEPGDRAVAFMVALEFAARKGMDIQKYLNDELYGPKGFVTIQEAAAAKRMRDRKPRIRIKMENME